MRHVGRARSKLLGWFLAAFVALMPTMTAFAQNLDALLPEANEDDVGYLTRLLQDSLSGLGRDVRIVGFRGALSSRATFDQLIIGDEEGVWLLIEDAALQWNRSALFQRRIEIGEISARRVTVARAPVGNGSEAESDELFALPDFTLPELPVSVRLDQLQVEEVVLGEALLGEELRARVSGSAALAGGEGQAQLRIERIDDLAGEFRLEAAFSNETRILNLDLTAEEEAGGLAVSLLDIPGAPAAALTVQGEGLIENFGADITLATDGVPRVEGRFEFQTPQNDVAQALSLDLAGDLRPLLQEDFHPFFGQNSELRTQARRFTDGRLSLDDLVVRTEKLGLQGRLSIGADGLPEMIDLRGEVAARDGSRVLLPVAGARTSIESAELALEFDASVDEDWDLSLDILGFDNDDFRVESLTLSGLGRITSDGFGGDIDVVDALIEFAALGLSASDPGLNEALGPAVTGSLALIWREDAPLLLPGFQLEGRDYALNGRARLDQGIVVASAQANFRDISRLSTLAGRPLSGAIETQVDATVGPQSDRFAVQAEIAGQNLTLDQAELDLLLQGRSQITLDVQGDNGQINLHRLEAAARTLRADLRGQVSPETVNLRGEVDFSDLSVLGGAFGGAIEAELVVQGAPEAEQFVIEATARDLTVGQEEANRLLRGDTQLSVSGQRDGTAVDLAALRLNNTALQLTGMGRYEEGASSLDLQLTLPDLGAIRPGFGGRIAADASLREEGTTRRVTLNADASSLRLGNPAVDGLFAGTHRLNVALVQRPEDILLENVTLSGPQLNANLSGSLVEGRPNLVFDARLANLATVVEGFPGAVTLTGTARDTGEAYALDVAVNGPAGLNAQVAGTLSPELRADLRAQGGLDLALVNPRLEPRSIQGPARFDVTVNGPLAVSSVSGQAEASGITLVLPQQNLRLADINAQAQIQGGRVTVNLGGRSVSGGQVALDGDIDLAAPITGNLRATLTGLVISDPQLFETSVSGQVAITGALTQGPLISGGLTLDQTELRIPRVGLATRGYIPPDIRHLGDGAAARQTRDRAGIFRGETNGREQRPAALDLTIDAPNRIFLRGRGLDAELGGTLRLTGTTADVIPVGQFGLIRGRLDLLGNRFTLNEGFASLQGDLVPFIRLVASTERDGVTARIVLEGEATAPEIRFESTPELPEEEVVSLLLFGRGFESLSLFQAAQLASSLATLSGRSEGFLDRVRRNVGLDDLDVRTDEDGETSVRLGRYLTENIYTDVEVSPQGTSEVSINIDLTSSLTARGRVNNEGRAGIGLFFERDY